MSICKAKLAKIDFEKQYVEYEVQKHNDLMREREAEIKAQAHENERKERAAMKRLKAIIESATRQKSRP